MNPEFEQWLKDQKYNYVRRHPGYWTLLLRDYVKTKFIWGHIIARAQALKMLKEKYE
jgi:hypothetical protein